MSLKTLVVILDLTHLFFSVARCNKVRSILSSSKSEEGASAGLVLRRASALLNAVAKPADRTFESSVVIQCTKVQHRHLGIA